MGWWSLLLRGLRVIQITSLYLTLLLVVHLLETLLLVLLEVGEETILEAAKPQKEAKLQFPKHSRIVRMIMQTFFGVVRYFASSAPRRFLCGAQE
jgi:hypothetical protein